MGSIDRVARRHRVAPKRLTWWRWWLAREERATAKAAPTARSRGKEQRFLPVEVSPPPILIGGAAVEIAIGDIKLRVESGTEPSYVAALVEALRRC